MRANRWEMRAVGAVVIVLGLVQVYTSWMLIPDHYPRSHARSSRNGIHHSLRSEANTSLQIENIMTDLSALKAELYQLRVHAEQERRATSLQLAAALNNSHSAITQIHVLREANIRMNDQLERFVNASREATSTSTFSTILSKVFNKKSTIEIQHQHQHGANTSSSWLSLSKSQPLGSYHAGNSSIGNWLQAYARGPRSISPLKQTNSSSEDYNATVRLKALLEHNTTGAVVLRRRAKHKTQEDAAWREKVAAEELERLRVAGARH